MAGHKQPCLRYASPGRARPMGRRCVSYRSALAVQSASVLMVNGYSPENRLAACSPLAPKQARQVGGNGFCFSADSRLLAVQDAGEQDYPFGGDRDRPHRRAAGEPRSMRRNGRDLQPQRFAPGRHHIRWPGGARLGPCALKLAAMGLDWIPAYSETEPVDWKSPRPLTLVVDMGDSGRRPEIASRPSVGPPAGGETRRSDRRAPGGVSAVARCRQVAHNNLAWLLVIGPEPLRNPTEALEHALATPFGSRRGNSLAQTPWASPSTVPGQGPLTRPRTLKKSLLLARANSTHSTSLPWPWAHHRLDTRPGRGCIYPAVCWVESRKTCPPSTSRSWPPSKAERG